MQYKIPIQIENEDVIVLGLSLRQLAIMMVWWGLAYTVFSSLAPRVWPEIAAVPTVLLAVTGITIALVRVAEMTFLPTVLNFFRLSLNAKSRMWSQWTDSYADIDVGYVAMNTEKAPGESNKSIEKYMSEDTNANDNILKL
jgi:PrgI family protein